ncbi:hypothetical protein HYG93_09245 [Acinetobacter sp. SwsAc6]|uniref:hypothetical protein n=1 Tax=unclassified Acinetobacter TaxID=196816 RepID=UPI000CDC0833|nr:MULTISPECIES: hypothetical protein [unclassified Acinetobacter]AUX85696.1 hypothetical protein C3F34_06205 [Acinetobacter sp. ACNIH2]NWK74472.1 hypothetical protein [Acinetobacter sp. SwsAc6]
MSNTNLSLCLLENEIQVYKSQNQIDWSIIPIKGEDTFIHHNDQSNIKAVLDEVNKYLNDDGLAFVDVSILYTNSAWLNETIIQLHAFKNTSFQILNFYNLVDYVCRSLNVKQPDSLSSDWIRQRILPLTNLENSWKEHQKLLDAIQLQGQLKQAQQQQDQSLIETDFAKKLADLQQERQKLQIELQQIQQQLVSVQRPNLENLLSFLPSIFKNFWNTVRPDELVNIVGLLDVPQVSSPFHNPSIAAVRTKKRQFLILEESEQQKIIGFCQQLKQQYDLHLHLEFQPIIGALD